MDNEGLELRHIGSDSDPQPTPPEISEVNAVMRCLNGESDRGACLISGAYLDELLEKVIRAFLIECKEADALFSGPNAPIGTFYAKSVLAYSLGLIEKEEMKEIEIVRKIRNEFAHGWTDIKFDDEKVSKEVGKLPWRGPEKLCEAASPRQRFIMSIAMLIGDLIWRNRLVQEGRRKSTAWSNKWGAPRIYK